MDIKGAFRVTKTALINTYFIVLLTEDSFVFVNAGKGISGTYTTPISEAALNQIQLKSIEEILGADGKNFTIPFNEISSINLKKSFFGQSFNGLRIGMMALNKTSGQTLNFDIAVFQELSSVRNMIQSVIPDRIKTFSNLPNSEQTHPEATFRTAEKGNWIIRGKLSNDTNIGNTITAGSGSVKAPISSFSDMDRNKRIVKNSSIWLFLIAGLSTINFYLYLSGSRMTFLAGLGITQVFGVFVKKYESLALPGIIATILSVGLFVFLAIFGRKGKLWAYATAIALYSLDTLIFLFARDWLSVGFHAFNLVFLFAGARAAFALKKNQIGNSV